MKTICMMSGGVASWVAARRIVDAQGSEGVTLLFCDTRIEDEGTCEFLHAGAEQFGLPRIPKTCHHSSPSEYHICTHCVNLVPLVL